MTYPQEGGTRCLWDVVEFPSCMSAIWEQHICLFCEKRDLLTLYNGLWKLFSLFSALSWRNEKQVIFQKSNLKELSSIKDAVFLGPLQIFCKLLRMLWGWQFSHHLLIGQTWRSIINLYLATSIFLKNLLPELGLVQNLNGCETNILGNKIWVLSNYFLFW